MYLFRDNPLSASMKQGSFPNLSKLVLDIVFVNTAKGSRTRGEEEEEDEEDGEEEEEELWR